MAPRVTGLALAARRARQWATSNMPKCGCGAVAGLGQTQCGRCRDPGDGRPFSADEAIEIATRIEDHFDRLEFLKSWVEGDWKSVAAVSEWLAPGDLVVTR